VEVRLFTGAEGVNLDFSMFSFHVPRELSAANTPIAVIAMPMMSSVKMFRIASPPTALKL
jgi:hypothetical protein